jgi:hypothetical protein
MHQSAGNKTKFRLLNRWILSPAILATLVLGCVLLLAFLAIVVNVYNRGYPIAPSKFYAQSHTIAIGSNKYEIYSHTLTYTHIYDDQIFNTIRIVLEPLNNKYLFRNNKYINIEYDGKGCITRVYNSDG